MPYGMEFLHAISPVQTGTFQKGAQADERGIIEDCGWAADGS